MPSTKTIKHIPVNPPILDEKALNDKDRFIKIEHVPLIDVHNDPVKGNIDLNLLKLIAKNSNNRVDQGEPILVTVGHMKRKNTIIVVHPDGRKIILPGTDEKQQPPIVGYAKNLTVDRFRDNDWLHGDFYIKKENSNEPIENPFRSVERVVPPDDGGDDGDDQTRHYIDRISLLRTPPEREGGVIHYDREDGIIGCCGTSRHLLKICYARDQEPLKGKDMPIPNGAVADQNQDGIPDAEESPDPEEVGGLPGTVGEMSPQDFFEGMAHVVRLILEEKNGGGEEVAAPRGGESVPYERNLSKNAHDELEIARRVPYEQGTHQTQAGGSNTYIPGLKGKKTDSGTVKTGRLKYERDETRREPVAAPRKPIEQQPVKTMDLKDVITRHQYAKDKGEVDEIVTYLYSQLSDMQLNNRRINYRQTLHGLRDMEGVDLTDEDIETLVNQVADTTPQDHETSKVGEIRKYYSRRAVNVPQVSVGLPPFANMGASSNQPATPEEARRATALRMNSDGKLSYAEALVMARAK